MLVAELKWSRESREQRVRLAAATRRALVDGPPTSLMQGGVPYKVPWVLRVTTGLRQGDTESGQEHSLVAWRWDRDGESRRCPRGLVGKGVGDNAEDPQVVMEPRVTGRQGFRE